MIITIQTIHFPYVFSKENILKEQTAIFIFSGVWFLHYVQAMAVVKQ